MTDFHSHVLPGIDDGSDSLVTSLAMLEVWREQGIERVCATPHFYADRDTPERFFRRRSAAYDALREVMSDRDYPSLLLGAEVHFFDGISAVDGLERFCLQGADFLLLEMPFARWTERMLGEVSELRRRGIRPVAAHIERYLSLQPAKTMQRFLEQDILIQCNAEFFLCRRTARKALRMAKEGHIHFLGSDAHNLVSRPPNLRPALQRIEKKLSPDVIEHFLSWDAQIYDSRKRTAVFTMGRTPCEPAYE